MNTFMFLLFVSKVWKALTENNLREPQKSHLFDRTLPLGTLTNAMQNQQINNFQ